MRAHFTFGAATAALLMAGGLVMAGGNPEIPKDAVSVGGDLYMVPAGKDSVGCAMYRAFSPTKMVAQAIYWRTKEGKFVIDRNAADCPKP